jgi:hypothetical protein
VLAWPGQRPDRVTAAGLPQGRERACVEAVDCVRALGQPAQAEPVFVDKSFIFNKKSAQPGRIAFLEQAPPGVETEALSEPGDGFRVSGKRHQYPRFRARLSTLA